MTDELLTWQALGIAVDPQDIDGLRVDCISVARRLAHAQKKVIGLLPVNPAIGALAVGLKLGQALADVTRASVALVDANLRWPVPMPKVRSEPLDVGSPHFISWLQASLAVVTAAEVGTAGAGLPQLARVIQRGGERFRHLIIDLTGLGQFGEHLAAIEMMDAVLVVARAGQTREEELLRVYDDVPPHLYFGVILASMRG